MCILDYIFSDKIYLDAKGFLVFRVCWIRIQRERDTPQLLLGLPKYVINSRIFFAY